MIDLFPGAMCKPITVREAIGMEGSYTNSSFEWKRQKNKPFQTLTKNKSKSHLVFDGGQKRYLKLDELLKGGSYPNLFRFFSFNQAVQCIGNSVPPLFMRAIASNIRLKMFDGKSLPDYIRMDYLEILESAWQDHLAPKDENAPTVISTFAGGGGSSLGYSMAGYRELLAVECDNNAVATFKLNFPDVPVYHGDIAKLSVEECMRLAGLSEPGQLDLLDGSPPCQGVSTAGKRLLNDPRNQLFREFVRLLRGLKPKVFVMENVSGLVKGKMKLLFAEIMRELKASGYQVRCKLMNTMYFYVPQSRERLIWIGIRDDFTHSKFTT
jgi:site-specific DNA-cytosine methylase